MLSALCSHLSLIAKLSWPRFGPYPTSCPHTLWNDGTRAACSCLPDRSHKKALAIPHVNQRWPELFCAIWAQVTIYQMGLFRFTSRLHLAYSTVGLPYLFWGYLGHICYFTNVKYHIHFVRATGKPEVPHHCLKLPTSVCYLALSYHVDIEIT